MSGEAFTEVFGGNTIYPTDYSYQQIALSSDIALEWPLDAATGTRVVTAIIDVATDGIWSITMPDATLASTGQVVMLNNLGPDTIAVLDASGGGLLSIVPGAVWQIYLTDNTTEAGAWRSFQSGASTAQAQAAALAGAGLVAIGSVLAQSSEVTVLTASPYTLSDGNRAEVFVWEGALGTLNLPSASVVGNNWFVNVRNGGTGDLVIDPASSETINGETTLRLSPGDSAVLVTDGTDWWTIGLGQQAVFAFDYTVVSLNGLGNSMTPTDYTLSGSELNRIVYKFTGTLAGDIEVVVPATIQQYWFDNSSTGGSYTVSIKADGSATLIGVPRNQRGIYYCNGTDVIKADTTSGVPVPLLVSEGGTGATSAPNARTNLGAAASGANSDITSLAGLTTPLSILQGGTGSGTAGGARTNLGATVVGDAVFTAANPAAGRVALTAAQSGTNADISSLSVSGGVTAGAPTGGAQGTGTINATGLFVNGVPVGVSGGSVSSVNASGGSTGMSFTGGPVTTSGTLTLTGTLGVANGGTGLSATPANGQLNIGNGAGFTRATITAGTGITVTNGAGSIQISTSGGGSGSVTSVNVDGASTGLTFTGGPVTTSGTITLGGTLGVAYGGTGGTTAATARGNLGIQNMALQTAAAVAITGGTVTGITDLAVADGGTGASSAASARSNLAAAASGANTDITTLTGLSSGSAGAPSISFAGDTDTGIYRVAANSMSFVASAADIFTVNLNGLTCQPGVGFTVTTGNKFSIAGSYTPASSSATGVQGTICWDSSYIYVCVSANSWRRVALATF